MQNQTKKQEQLQQQAQKQMNDLMQKLIPETASAYAVVPMAQGRWLDPEEALMNGKLCFIAASKQQEIRKDYIWVPANEQKGLEAGYYHFRTKAAHVQAKKMLKKFKPQPIFSRKDDVIQNTKDREAYHNLKIIFETRILSDCADDIEAAKARMEHLEKKQLKYSGWYWPF